MISTWAVTIEDASDARYTAAPGHVFEFEQAVVHEPTLRGLDPRRVRTRALFAGNCPRGDGVYSNAARFQFQGQDASHMHDPRLGNPVAEVVGLDLYADS